MKKYYILFIYITIVSCSSQKPIIVNYDSVRLCNGIKNINEFIEKSSEIKKSLLRDESIQAKLNFEINTNIIEGISFPTFTTDIAKLVQNEEKISLEQAYKKLEIRFLARREIYLITDCLKKTNISRPDFIINYYYYPEYGLLTADITRINYKPEYGEGYLILAKTDSNGEIEILKTGFWEQ